MLDLERMWELAKVWYRGRLDADWRGRDVDEARKILDDLGLDGDFWRME